MLPSLSSGQTVLITRAASVQFNPFQFRIISVDERPTCVGWAWLRGYQLDPAGEALVCRDVFVRVAGLESAPRREPSRIGGRP
jgi:hypothetical protein